VQELVAAMAPFSTGRTNRHFPGLGDEADFVRAGFGPSWERLVEVKRRYDPDNLFRLNQNVDPRGAG
jgi:FAD/FMN-containing dehydrogenase